MREHISAEDHDDDRPALEYVLHRLAEMNDRISHMATAAEERDVIGLAKGILMERYKIGPDEATALLLTASHKGNTTVVLMARTLISHGSLGSPPRPWNPEGRKPTT